MTTDATISARIIALLATGLTLPQAVDAVLGEGTYARIASETYDAIRSQAR